MPQGQMHVSLAIFLSPSQHPMTICEVEDFSDPKFRKSDPICEVESAAPLLSSADFFVTCA